MNNKLIIFGNDLNMCSNFFLPKPLSNTLEAAANVGKSVCLDVIFSWIEL